MGSLAHWLFAAQYFRLAMTIPVLFSQTEVTSELLKRKRKCIFWTDIIINLIFYVSLVYYTIL